MCFDQLLGATRTQKLVEIFFSRFSTFLCFDQILGALSTQKLVEEHNTRSF